MSRINERTSPECMEYLKKGGNLAVIPLGCIERLGPHLPLGARGKVVDAIAMALAEKCGGLCLPIIPYSTVYDTSFLAGSIDIEPQLIHSYLSNLCDELVANCFRRIVVVGFQEEIYYLCHEFFQSHNIAVAWLHPDQFYAYPGTARDLDRHGQELWRLTACLSFSKNNALLERVLRKTEECYGKFPVVKNPERDALNKLGTTAHRLLPREWLIYPVTLGCSLKETAEAYTPPTETAICKAQKELEDWLDSLREPVEALDTYQAFLDGHPLQRPQ